jgi:C2 domain
VLRRPLSGTLEINVKSAKSLFRPPTTSRFSRRSESVVVVKVEDTPRARTHPSRGSTDRWNEDFQIHVDKANEVEVTIYDRASGDTPVPVGMLWIRLSDIVEELRRRKVGGDSGPGWVTAERMQGGQGGSGGGGMDVPVGQFSQQSSRGIDYPAKQQTIVPTVDATGQEEGITAWFAVEPEGRIELRLNFSTCCYSSVPVPFSLSLSLSDKPQKSNRMSESDPMIPPAVWVV